MKNITIIGNKSKILNFIKNLQPEEEFEFQIKKISSSRTLQQNKALHLYFIFVAEELNNLGITFQYKGIKGMDFEMPYTAARVKEYIWKPIQMALFGFESTTKLTTDKINKIYDIINKFFCEKGIYIEFPNKDMQNGEQIKKNCRAK